MNIIKYGHDTVAQHDLNTDRDERNRPMPMRSWRTAPENGTMGEPSHCEVGVDPVVYEAVNVLTRRSGETYMDYIRRICGVPGVAGEIARLVKVADLTVSVDRAGSDTLRQRYEQSLPLVQGALATARG